MKPQLTDIQKKILLAMALPAALLLLACVLIPPKVTGLYRAQHVQELENNADRMAKFTDALFAEHLTQLRLLATSRNWHEPSQKHFLDTTLRVMQAGPLRTTSISIFTAEGSLIASTKTLSNTADSLPVSLPGSLPEETQDIPAAPETDTFWLNETQKKGSFIGTSSREANAIPHALPGAAPTAAPQPLPLLTMAVQEETGQAPIIVMATVDTTQLLPFLTTQSSSIDSFFINKNGALQTESRFLGPVQTPSHILWPTATHAMTNETLTGQPYLLFKVQLNTAPWALVLAENDTRIPMSVTHANMLFLRCLGAAFLALAFCTWHIMQRVDRHQAKPCRADSEPCPQDKDIKKTSEAITAGIIHDMNARLMLIREYAGWMTDLLHDEKPETMVSHDKLQHSIQKIEQSVDLANDISRSLLQFIRHESAPAAPLFLAPLITGAVDSLRHRARSKAVTIHTYAEEQEIQVAANAGQLEQIMLNVLNNAIDAVTTATFPDTSSSQGTISVTIKKRQKTAVIIVQDNGSGILPEHMGKLFEPFYTVNKPEKGTGLGLFMCASLLKALGGSITATNAPEGGAIFTIILPLAHNDKVS